LAVAYFNMAISLPMATPEEEARAYLNQALTEADISYKDASAAIGKNDAYIQQYIGRGKPYWLKEPEREALVRFVPGLNGERLKPPPKQLKPRVNTKGTGRKRKNQSQIDAPRDSEVVYEPSALKLVRAYLKISNPERRALALGVVESFADDESGSAVA
jgi:hypothetical protein